MERVFILRGLNYMISLAYGFLSIHSSSLHENLQTFGAASDCSLFFSSVSGLSTVLLRLHIDFLSNYHLQCKISHKLLTTYYDLKA
uniref:Uncharacterized protein n=1 Tax=Megaselia scalaris TaxID=36166 RepID=T1GN10_MEGSC